MTPKKTWADFERERVALQEYSPRFSRAELCRRAGIDSTTFLKGLKNGTAPRPSKHSAVNRALGDELDKIAPTLSDKDRQLLEWAMAGERAAIDGGLR